MNYTPMSYQVRVFDDEKAKTGLDGRFFPTYQEAEKAIDVARDVYGIKDASILGADCFPDTTFEEWNQQPL